MIQDMFGHGFASCQGPGRTTPIQDSFGYPSEGLWNPASRKEIDPRAFTKKNEDGGEGGRGLCGGLQRFQAHLGQQRARQLAVARRQRADRDDVGDLQRAPQESRT